MNKKLPDVISDILTYHGTIVEKTNDGSLDVITTPEISDILKMPEYARLIFSYGEISNESIYASYDSEFFNSLSRLFADGARFTVARFEPHIPHREKRSGLIPDSIAFRNATFRLEHIENRDISYLLVYFRYTALSDEKHEGIMPVLVNEMNLSSMPFKSDIIELIELDEPKNIERFEAKMVFHSAYSAATQLVKENLMNFIKSLERRLNRDIKRVYEYYETLKQETKEAIKRKAITHESSDFSFLKEIQGDVNPHGGVLQVLQKIEQHVAERDNLVEKQIEEETIKGDGIDKLLNKLNAIQAEQKWKIQDLISKYILSIKIEPVAAIRIETYAPIFWINIKRRLASRRFPVTYNPILRQIDVLPCESCFNPHAGYYICDGKLHIACGHCFKTCPDCGRQFCNACYNICPKCRK